jgi:hypothetical protein
LTNLGSELEKCVGSRVHLVGVSISFEKNFYRLPFTPPSLVRRFGPSPLSAAAREGGGGAGWRAAGPAGPRERNVLDWAAAREKKKMARAARWLLLFLLG